MANPIGNLPVNPFDNAFEMLGHVPEVTTKKVNSEALELLTEALTTRAVERGRMILLRSPRAGFGKTHLLMRLNRRVAHTHEFISLEPTKGRYLDAQSVLDAVLRRFSRVLPAGGGLTVLDLLARRILAAGLEPLVKSGEVPSQDRESALQALQLRPVETFDFHNEEAVTARWAKSNFSLLGPRLTSELAERTDAGYRPVAWWVELLFRYSSADIDQTSRNSALFETVFGGDKVETDIHEKLVTLLNLTGLVTSPVLILDEVEGFSSNPEAALQVTTFLNALHQSCSKLALIISVNGDVWETAFLPRIPCGLKDRLSDIVIDLKPMDKDTAVELLRDRAGEKAEDIANNMDFDSGVVYARGLIREASSAWEKMAASEAIAADEDGESHDPISLVVPEPVTESTDDSSNIDPEPTPEPEPHVAESARVPTEYIANVASAATLAPELGSEEAIEPSADELKTPEPTESQELQAEVQSDPVRLDPMGELDPEGELDDLQEYVDEPNQGAEAEPQSVFPPDLKPYLPADLPQPFANQPPQEQQEQVGQVAQLAPQETADFAPQQAPSDPISPATASPFDFAESPQPFAPTIDQTSGGEAQNVAGSPFGIDPSASETVTPFQPAQPSIQGSQPLAENVSVQGTPFQPASPQPQVQQPSVETPFSVDDGKAPPHTVTAQDHEKVEDLLKQFRDRYGRD